MNDFIIVYNDELYHHGVKGMRWGHRKTYYKGMTYGQMKKAVKADRKLFTSQEANKTYSKEIEENRRKNQEDWRKADKKAKQANELLKKYNFDGDDGGGGKTAADRKAGKKYAKLWKEAEDLYNTERSTDVENIRNKNIQKKLIEKYGEKTLKEFEKDRINRGSKIAAVPLIAGGLGLLTLSMIKGVKQ